MLNNREGILKSQTGTLMLNAGTGLIQVEEVIDYDVIGVRVKLTLGDETGTPDETPSIVFAPWSSVAFIVLDEQPIEAPAVPEGILEGSTVISE